MSTILGKKPTGTLHQEQNPNTQNKAGHSVHTNPNTQTKAGLLANGNLDNTSTDQRPGFNTVFT